ncbi:MAG: helix-turn-helix domain-containing protein, partial [Reyranella sp.]|uniref:helix-turn-helix domain-containing protein n=2 Tax=Reyranella sp. TaxID=1929291 RepID=UPI003D11852E
MMRKRPRYVTKEEKLAALTRLASGESAAKIADELGVVRRVLWNWRKAYQRLGQAAFQP